MKPADVPRLVRIGVRAPERWVAAGLVVELGAAAAARAWDLQLLDRGAVADAWLLHDPATAEWAALPPQAPAVALGGVLPIASSSTLPARTERPLALLAANADPARVTAALLAVLAGLHVRDPARPADPPSAALAASAAGAGDAEPLTEREVQVLELIAKGMTNRDIGALLGISTHTVKFHVTQLLDKLGAASRAEAVGSALRLGLIGV